MSGEDRVSNWEEQRIPEEDSKDCLLRDDVTAPVTDLDVGGDSECFDVNFTTVSNISKRFLRGYQGHHYTRFVSKRQKVKNCIARTVGALEAPVT